MWIKFSQFFANDFGKLTIESSRPNFTLVDGIFVWESSFKALRTLELYALSCNDEQ